MKSLSYLHWIKNVFSSKLNAKCVRRNIKLVKKFQITSLVLKAKLKLFASITYLSFLYRSEVMERERWTALFRLYPVCCEWRVCPWEGTQSRQGHRSGHRLLSRVRRFRRLCYLSPETFQILIILHYLVLWISGMANLILI